MTASLLKGNEVLARVYDRYGHWVNLRVVDAENPPACLVLEKIRYDLKGPRYVEREGQR